MDFEFYRNFITVAEIGNLTTAAKKLSLAQPALSAQVKTLEQYYGTPLIETSRGKRQLTLTEAGAAFLSKARQICSTEESLVMDLQNFKKKNAGTLCFSISPAKSAFFLNTYLRPFAMLYPEISYKYREEAVSAQIKQIEENACDFAFANAPLLEPQLFSAHKTPHEEYFYAVCVSQSAYAFQQQQPLTSAQLANIPICCNFGCYSLLRKACRKYGFIPQIRFIATTTTAALTFVLDGAGVAVVSSSNPDEFPAGLQYWKLEDDELYFEQTLFWSAKKKLSSIAKLFLNFYLDKCPRK